MDNDNVYENPWAGQQPDDIEHVINYLNSDYGPLLLALRPLRNLPHTLIIPIHHLLLTLDCIFTRMNGPFVRQLIPVILVEVAERYEPGAGFYVNVVIGFMPHISERFRPKLALLSQLGDQCQVFLIILTFLVLFAIEQRLE
ncbi:hypothetical protein FPRO05_12097 [Fusarium proliferatum]|uniref:Uncharacterized protein n=1 Tax=Gibberella intermedia TaxID=948311 RepID=A0A365N542_GIBIN|nr:hypothetical protein FPRO05_12097 [Fusarium proliferatum]